jgi:nucleotide-binding universal stress UspA family protein
MYDEIMACLDGSPLAEKILPLARGLTASTGGRLTLLRVVEHMDELAGEEEYLRNWARQSRAELRVRVASDPAAAILTELDRDPRAIAALTTHGRNAWMEAILGSVAMCVVREAKRPVIIFRPFDAGEAPKRITTVAVALDGTRFAERIIPYAVKTAQTLSTRLLLVQALPIRPETMPIDHEGSDVLESAYLHRKAAEIKESSGIEAEWEVLHGEPGDAICRHVSDLPEAMLAVTTHARPPLSRLVLGSVAATCLRRAGVPLLLYWPHR